MSRPRLRTVLTRRPGYGAHSTKLDVNPPLGGHSIAARLTPVGTVNETHPVADPPGWSAKLPLLKLVQHARLDEA